MFNSNQKSGKEPLRNQSSLQKQSGEVSKIVLGNSVTFKKTFYFIVLQNKWNYYHFYDNQDNTLHYISLNDFTIKQ